MKRLKRLGDSQKTSQNQKKFLMARILLSNIRSDQKITCGFVTFLRAGNFQWLLSINLWPCHCRWKPSVVLVSSDTWILWTNSQLTCVIYPFKKTSQSVNVISVNFCNLSNYQENGEPQYSLLFPIVVRTIQIIGLNTSNFQSSWYNQKTDTNFFC